MALPQTDAVALYIPNGSGGVDTVTVDACVKEQHNLANTITDHPVETGSNISDHSRPEPRKFSLDVVVSNTPIGVDPATIDGALAYQFWQRLVSLWATPQLLDVQTARDFYKSVAIESVSSPVDARSAQSFVGTITFKQVRVVQNKYSRVTISPVPKAHAKNKQGGAQKTTVAEDKDPLRPIVGVFGIGNG